MAADRTGGPQSATLAQVAAEAGVGKATAARALGNYGSVSPAVKERVLAVAERLRYRPNILARSMSTGVTNTIGVVVADISNPFFAGVVRSIADECYDRGYSAVVMNTDERMDLEREAVGVLADKQVDAIILSPAAVDDDGIHHIEEVLARGIPVVLLDRVLAGLDLTAVVIDNYEASKQAVAAFSEAGHRRIGFAWGPPAGGPARDREEMWSRSRSTLWSDGERLRGYLDGLQQARIPFDPELVTYCDRNEDDLSEAVTHMLQGADRMTAVLTTETEALTGTLLALNRAGLGYPEDLSIIGFDDSPWARAVRPALTMIAQPMAEMGRAAAERAFQAIRREAEGGEVVTLHAVRQERSSVREPSSTTLR